MGFEALTDPFVMKFLLYLAPTFRCACLVFSQQWYQSQPCALLDTYFMPRINSIFDIETLILLRDQIYDIWLGPQVIKIRFNLILMGVTSVS